MQKYDVGPVTLNLQRETVFTPLTVHFSFSVNFDSLVPETEEKSDEYHSAITRAILFLQGINTAFVMETSSHLNEIFLTGQIGNINIEVPNGCNTVPLFGTIIYNKVKALMGEFEINEFTMTFPLVDSIGGTIESTLVYNKDTEDRRLNQVFKTYEQMWEEQLTEIDEEFEEDDFEGERKAWWNRKDGNVRDFVDVSEDAILSGGLKILTVDVGDENESIGNYYTDGDDDNDPKTPDTDDDGYVKF